MNDFERHVNIDVQLRFHLASPDDWQEKTITRVIDEYNHGDKWYVFYIEDVMDPPFYLVGGSSFQDAMDNFLEDDKIIEALKIPEVDFGDYEDDKGQPTGVTFNDSGDPLDAQHVQGFGPVALPGQEIHNPIES